MVTTPNQRRRREAPLSGLAEERGFLITNYE